MVELGSLVDLHEDSPQKTAAHRAKISSISASLGKKRVYVQILELLPMAKFHAQVWQFWKTANIQY